MSLNEDFDSRMTQIDAATTQIATEEQELRDIIASGEILSPETKAAMLDKMDQRIKVLQLLGKPESPVTATPVQAPPNT